MMQISAIPNKKLFVAQLLNIRFFRFEFSNCNHNREGTTMSDNLIYIGTKPLMNYVTAVVMQFTTKNAQTVSVKARGKFICRAVDVAEVATKRFLDSQVEISSIGTNSEEFTSKEGKQVRVSSIEIVLKQKSAK
jgi:archaea-specific DNA-binding protein